jgi:hypothetical protein
MYQGVDFADVTQPEIEGDIGVARRPLHVVVSFVALCARAAIGLQGDDEIAVDEAGEAEGVAGKGGVGLRHAPCVVEACDEICGKRFEQARVVRERDGDRLCAFFERANDRS